MIIPDQFAAYCLAKRGVEKTWPFGPDTQVYKVMGKIFALHGIIPFGKPQSEDPLNVNLKCDPDWSIILREHYSAVNPGYHMNKKHWNTVTLDGSIPEDEIWEMVDHSYTLVVKSLKRSEKDRLAGLP